MARSKIQDPKVLIQVVRHEVVGEVVDGNGKQHPIEAAFCLAGKALAEQPDTPVEFEFGGRTFHALSSPDNAPDYEDMAQALRNEGYDVYKPAAYSE